MVFINANTIHGKWSRDRIFINEDMENILRCIFQYLTVHDVEVRTIITL